MRPIYEAVDSNFHSRLFSSLRLPSLAGSGLPERMRSTAFAFLGLTAAAGLTFVAIFAQLGFPLLAPSPLPSDPARENAVAEAVPLHSERRGGGEAGAQSAEPPAAGDFAAGERDAGGRPTGAPVGPGAPAASPGGAAAEPGQGGEGSTPATPAPTPGTAPESPPVIAPPAAESTPAFTAPGNSAASHASERGIEASSKGASGSRTSASGSKTSASGSKRSSPAAAPTKSARTSRSAPSAEASTAPPSIPDEDPTQGKAPQGKAKGHLK